MAPKKTTDKKGNQWFLIAAILGGGYLLMNQGGGGALPGFTGSSGGGRRSGGLLQRLLANDGDFTTDEDIGVLPLTQAADLLPGSPYTVEQAGALGAATILTSSYGPVYIPELSPGIYTIPFTTPDEFVAIAEALESANPGVTISTQYTQRILAAERAQIADIAALPDYLQGVADAARRKARIEHQISFPNPSITTFQREFIQLHDPDFDFDSLREDTADPGGLNYVRDAVDTAVAQERASGVYDFDDFYTTGSATGPEGQFAYGVDSEGEPYGIGWVREPKGGAPPSHTGRGVGAIGVSSQTYDFDDFYDDSDAGGPGDGGSGGGSSGGSGSASQDAHDAVGETEELGF